MHAGDRHDGSEPCGEVADREASAGQLGGRRRKAGVRAGLELDLAGDELTLQVPRQRVRRRGHELLEAVRELQGLRIEDLQLLLDPDRQIG